MESLDQSTVEAALKSTLEEISDGRNTVEVAVLCRSLLTALNHHSEVASKIAEIFAALGRESSSRDVASECCVLQSIVPLLSSDQSDLRLQAMRAVGNLCIDHDVNRVTVLSSDGCPYLISQLIRCTNLSASDSQSDRIKCVTCGCILNLCNDNEQLQKEFLSLGVISGLANIVAVPDQSEMVLQMALQATAILLDHADLDIPSSTSLPSSLCLLMTRCSQGEVDLTDTLFEIIESLIQHDVWKRALVKEGCVECLLRFIDTPDLEQKANDFLVTLLGEDECLEVIFKAGQLLSKALASLNSNSSTLQQRANASLVIANMARSEENCAVLIAKGVVPLLIDLTKMEETKELMGKLHHSALSALRNLSLPASNKQMFLECGVVEAAISSLQTSTLAHVWFKDLGILRLLVDKQGHTCSYIVSQKGCIERMCEVCLAIGPAHIQIEGSRLLAAIVKNASDIDVSRQIVSGGGVRCICLLLESEHSLLVNEGLISLNLLATLRDEMFYSSLADLDPGIDSRLSQTLTSTSLPVEVISNALMLVKALLTCEHELLKNKLSESKEIVTSLEGLTKHNDKDINSRALEIFMHLPK